MHVDCTINIEFSVQILFLFLHCILVSDGSEVSWLYKSYLCTYHYQKSLDAEKGGGPVS